LSPDGGRAGLGAALAGLDLDRLVERMRAQALTVVGDAMLDAWWWGPPRGLSREGPVPVVAVTDVEESPGGAGNAAVAAAALGAPTRLLAAVGDDADGRRLRALLAARGVDVTGLAVEPGRATLAKRRVGSGSHLHVRCDSGDERVPEPATARAIRAALARPDLPGTSVLACDYGAGMFTDETIDAAAAAVRAAGGRLVVDAHRPGRWARARPDLVKPNAAEARSLLGEPAAAAFDADRPAAVARYGADILRASGARLAAVTLDRDGVVVLSEDAPAWHLPAPAAVPDERTAGAGDTFVTALTLALAAGADRPAAVAVATVAAAVVVTVPGIGVCSADDLRAELGRAVLAADAAPARPGKLGPGSGGPDDRGPGDRGPGDRGPGDRGPGDRGPGDGVTTVLTAAEAARAVARHREAGRRIVFTNGCFDVLHAGHAAYLAAAAKLGDVLVVGVNSDRSVHRLKGPGRPVNPLADRLAVLAALAGLDHLVVFEDDTPAALLRALRPDVYVKGGDYTEAMLAEAALVRELGGEVRIVDYVEDHSTHHLLDRIRSGTGAGTGPGADADADADADAGAGAGAVRR